MVEQASQTKRFRPGDEVFGMPLFPQAAKAYAEVVPAPALHWHSSRRRSARRGVNAAGRRADVAGPRRPWRRGRGRPRPGPQRWWRGRPHRDPDRKALGAHAIATAGGNKRKPVEGFRANEVIDYTAVAFIETVRDIDNVLDTIGGETVERSLDGFCPGGHLVTVAAEENSELAAEYVAAGMRFNGIAVDTDPVALRGLVELEIQGRLRIHVQQKFPLERVTEAHRLLHSGRLQGKLVMTV
ncbi:NADPH:quinone reductase-like Zn-dependent oxidoreductase [Streptomyces sp. SAI-133]|nr:zinc-binding dehydrogenase [Streptomyces sp. SAI-133]MDH6581040.1 NADPH:quinone reductase-like Zn-dependent oxidoreductase [Streptomyces sp. SAI-133]